MSSFKSTSILSALAGAASVLAHGHVQKVIADGVEYQAFDLRFAYEQNPPVVVGWSTTALDNGFVAPSQFNTADIACHLGAQPAGGHAVVAAGGEVFLQWDTWPESHKGPIIDMLAPCGGDCASVDKASLEFFKIQEVGLVSGAGVSGTWASDQMIANGNGWLVKIPDTLAAGNYVLRHEMIAHHASGDPNGAQNYPQCINIQVTGGGNALPSGVVATSFYTPTDPGILFNLYTDSTSYSIPGPAAPSIASVVQQRRVTATSEGTPVVGGGAANPPASPPAEEEEEETTTPPATPPAEEEEEETTTPPANPPATPTPAPTPTPDECPVRARRLARRAARLARRTARV